MGLDVGVIILQVGGEEKTNSRGLVTSLTSFRGCTCGASPAPGPQMKLTVSQPGDQYEQEADRIANAVMYQERQGSAGLSQAQSIRRQTPEEDKDKLQGKISR
jgi:hypothetical protein